MVRSVPSGEDLRAVDRVNGGNGMCLTVASRMTCRIAATAYIRSISMATRSLWAVTAAAAMV